MANMGYCRFRNTLTDLRDAYEHMGEVEELSVEEMAARKRIISLAVEIVGDFGDEIGMTVDTL